MQDINQLGIIKKQKEQSIVVNLPITNNRSITSRKDFIWIDVEFYDNEFFVSQKLSSYFAQLEERSNERIEKINNYVNEIYKTLDFNFIIINENLDIKQEEEVYFEQILEYEELKDIINIHTSEFVNDNNNKFENFKTNVNDFEDDIFMEKSMEDENNDNTENDEDEDFIQFFVPLALVSYRNSQKKSDFYLANEFKQHLFFKKNISFLQNNLIKKKFLSKKYIFKNFNKTFFNKKFTKFNSLRSNFFKMINNSNISFFKKKRKYFTNKSHRISKKYRMKKKKKLLMFKKLKLKQKLEKAMFLKSFKWFSNVYLLILINLKVLHSYHNYSHINFLTSLYGFLCQIPNIKSKIYKRYKRRRRLKKEFFRNFEGKLGILNKQINDKEDNTKNKRRNKRKF